MPDIHPRGSAAVTPASDVKVRLLDDHRALEALLSNLESALECASTAELCEQWTRFELNLRDHLDTEERCLFPLVAASNRSEVEALRAEHQCIRKALSELGVALDLHTLRKASVDEFIVYLQRHALREENTLYRWVDNDVAAHRGLRAMFERRADGGVLPRNG